MSYVTVTRLRLRKRRFWFDFIRDSIRIRGQALAADGCVSAKVRRTRGGIYWTLTVWRDASAMRAFMTSGAHLQAMPKLLDWCDEASLAHWDQDVPTVTWAEAEQRLVVDGRTSKVRHPSPAQAAGNTMGTLGNAAA